MTRAGFVRSAAATLCFAVSISAHEFEYSATLNGASESPPDSSAGTGSVLITLDLDVITMHVRGSFCGLSGNVTSAHVHGLTTTPLTGTAGVASLNPTLPAFPTGVTSGTYDQTIDLTTASAYAPEFIAASGGTVSDALNALTFGMADGKTYFEIDTTAFPNGEVRGFLIAVPEPASLSLLTAGGLLLLRRRR
jgi:hypothetical protein